MLDAHPSDRSFCKALADAYESAAKDAGYEIERINLRELDFNPNLIHGYAEIQELEPHLQMAQKKIMQCQHLVLIFPIWWGSMPALLKGFFDRCLLPGYAFKYHEKDPFWDKLLKGRSARVIITSDAPVFYNWLMYLGAPYVTIKKTILGFCGFKPVKLLSIGSVKTLSASKREGWLTKVSALGRSGE